MAYVIGDDCIACGTCQGECPVEAISVRVSAPLRQFLRVRSILSIPISAQSVVLVQVYVLLRPSACPNAQGFIGNNEGCSERAPLSC